MMWSHFEGDPAFERFRIAEGRSLHEFSVFCALAEEHGGKWRQWPSAYRRADSPDVERFAQSDTDRVNFHTWLQWQMNQQFTHASKSVSLMQDLPVGFSPDGADAWVWQDLIASNMRAGAPLDLYNTEGQDWGLPPFIPHRLRTAEYEPFIQTIRAGMCHAGGLRIDHVMGLFRLWWVPQGQNAKNGAFVRYPVEDLLAIIAIESQRAGAVVVGEDLGTVEPGVREQLAGHNVLSYRLLWFEDTLPSQYPEKTLAAVTTHDLPTLAGVWTGKDLETQRQLGLNPDESANERFREKLRHTSNLPADADITLPTISTFEQLAQAPSAIVMASMEAACVAAERPNMPTAGGRYPSWSLALPLPLEDIESSEMPRKLASILNRLAQLEISHLYSSPVLQAIKEARMATMCWIIAESIENWAEKRHLSGYPTALRTHDLGLLLDIVPNHMAIGGKDNLWWWDVLENGQSSRYAPYFDVEWMPPESKLHHLVHAADIG